MNISASTLYQQKQEFNKSDFYTGLTLALASSFFIGSSFILKKKGLLKLCNSNSTSAFNQNGKSNLRAAQGGYGYLKEWLWWSGLITMGVGELCNFAAYGFVPATLVTPLGALSVLISAVMSAYFLNEKLNTIGKIGCFLTAIGSTVMVIHAPKEGEVKNVNELLIRLQDTEFISFTILSGISLIILIIYLVPKYGNTNVLIYILICSILGSFTVMSCKGLSLGIKEMFLVKPSVSYFYTYMFALIVISCIVIQMNYLNKSLDIFNTAIVTTVYYVLFTLFVMIASSLLFKELLNVSFQDFVGCLCGFCTIVCALCLIHFFKSTNDNNYRLNSYAMENRKINEFDDNYLSNFDKSNEYPTNNNSLIVENNNSIIINQSIEDQIHVSLSNKQVDKSIISNKFNNNNKDNILLTTKNEFNKNNSLEAFKKDHQLDQLSLQFKSNLEPSTSKINKFQSNPKKFKEKTHSASLTNSSFFKNLSEGYHYYKNIPKSYMKNLSPSFLSANNYSYNVLENDENDRDIHEINSKFQYKNENVIKNISNEKDNDDDIFQTDTKNLISDEKSLTKLIRKDSMHFIKIQNDGDDISNKSNVKNVNNRNL